MEEGKLDEAYEVAHGLLSLDGISSSQIPGRKIAGEARRLIREMSQGFRIEIRNAYVEKDIDEVLRIGAAAGDLLLSLPDGAIIYARALHSAGKVDEALDLMKRVRAEHPDNFAATRWAARLGALAGDYSTALELYGELRRSPTDESRQIDSELRQFFSSAGPRALKQLRRLIIEENVEEALHLARLIKQEVGSDEGVDRELNRLHSQLRTRLREIEQGEGDAEEGEALLRHMVDLRPADTRLLRKLALRLMGQLRFAEAAEVWERIQSVEPENATAPRQRERCLKMAKRRAQAWGAEIEAAA
jgi:tetratricopeptide (TPR) repeat protein